LALGAWLVMRREVEMKILGYVIKGDDVRAERA